MVDGRAVGRVEHGGRPHSLHGDAAFGGLREAQHGGPAGLGLHEESAVARRHRHRAGTADGVGSAAMRILENNAARFWLDAEEPSVAHRDHEVASADPQHHRRLILDRVIARRPTPRTGGRVEPGYRASLVCADLHHQDAVDHDRRGREAIVRLARTLASNQVRAPEEPARGQLHGDQLTARAESEHTSVGDGGCRDGAVERTVAAVERMADLNAPRLLARAHVEGNGDVLAAVREHRDRASGRDGHARVAAAELRAPAHGQASRCASEAAAGRCAAIVVRPAKARPLALGPH